HTPTPTTQIYTLSLHDALPIYEIRLDGKDHADPEDIHSTRSMKVIDEYTLEETYKTDGKVSGASRWVISRDGKSMQVEFSSKKRSEERRVGKESRLRKKQ